ncbi:MAG: hypothetical protein GY906_40080 [bacterium]|nr:hypothetical protein [bacterium]
MTLRMNKKHWTTLVFVALFVALGAGLPQAAAEDQDAETKALDSTATQWSFQFAYQTMDYHDDVLDNGHTRPAGLDNYVQMRIVAPFQFSSFTLLPRLTLRHYENAKGESGIGNTELFGLIIPKAWDWGSGRFGIGPLVTFPGNDKVAKDEWGYGLATAVVNGKGKWFYGLLFTQSWQAIDPQTLPTGKTDTNPLGIAPFLNYRLGNGWYIGNGDMVAQYDWDSSSFYLPIGVRVGKVLVKEQGSWNIYGECQTALIYDSWPGSAVESSIRFNVTYTMPMGN